MLNIIFTIFTISTLSFSQFSLTYKGQLDDSLKKRYQALGINPQPREAFAKSKLLAPAKIESLLIKSGLNTETQLTEQVDKDILFLKACKSPLKKFEAENLRLPVTKLKAFYELSHKYGC